MNAKIENPHTILVVQLAGLGDMVLALPALASLRELYPQAQILLLTNSRAGDIVRDSQDLNGVFVIDSVLGFLRLIARLRAYQFDLVINLYRIYSAGGALKMFLLFSAVGGKYWVGRDADGRGFFYHLKVKEALSDSMHEVEHKLDIIRALGGQIKETKFKIKCDRDDELFIQSFMEKEGVGPKDIVIGINCSTFRPSRNWVSAGYHELAERLVKELPVKVAVCGSNLNRRIFNEINADLSVRVIDVVGKLSVRQFIAFIKRCNLFISPDSGPAHLAAALGVPLVSLFGEGEYSKFRPYADEKMVQIIRIPVKLITAEEVFQAVNELLNRNV